MINLESIKMYDLQELSEKLGISVVSLREWIKQGKLKAKKLGVKYYVSEDSLIEFLKEDSKKEE
jgi:excisionase family DNA binding protein